MQRKIRRGIRFAKVSIPFNGALAFGKILTGILSASFFIGISSIYNLCMAIAKYMAVRTHRLTDETDGPDRNRLQYRCYVRIGLLVLISGTVYIVTCVNLFFGDRNAHYPPIVAIGIAAFTFTEIILSIRGFWYMLRNKEPVMEALKLTGVASSFVSLVLAQAALLSFSYEGNAAVANGLSGVVFGSAAALIGVFMLIRGSLQLRTPRPPGRHSRYVNRLRTRPKR